ncbi:hypothetical protein GCM10011367_18110 [Marinicauda pacifica]|nr:anthrone oxygenase family protein [Marinicauda pacifica]GGE43773.1 hypothetical protein GCM10011367_18110 [Marinicauda pacifica]
MTDDWPVHFSLFLALWTAVIAGVFSAFSEFVMRALSRAAPASGVDAMQQINVSVLRTQFVAGILLIPPISIGFAIYGFGAFDGLARISSFGAALVYTTMVFLVTVFGNVPMNNRLAGLDPHARETEAYWSEYGRVWTRLNHIRTLGSLFTAGLYLVTGVALLTE